MPHRKPSLASKARSRLQRAGFALAPILYMLGLIGVTAGVLFSGYSQVMRSNIAITDSLAVKNDLNASTQVLSASSKLGTDSTTLCPPVGPSPGAVCTGVAPTILGTINSGDVHAPTVYSGGSAVAYSSGAIIGTAKEVGGFAVGGGIKQLDPWGHYYIYCRWENLTTTGQTSPSILIISAGSDGELETTCAAATANNGMACDLKAGCDDIVYYMNVGTVINHSTLWTAGTKTVGTSTVPDVNYGVNPVSVDAFGNLALPGSATIGTSTEGADLLNVGTAGHQLTVDVNGNLSVPGTSQLTGIVTTSSDVNVGGNLTGPSGGTLAVGASETVAGTLTTTGAVGIGTSSPKSELDVNGGTAIGSYAGSTAAPSNGLIVSGVVGIGTSSANANTALTIDEGAPSNVLFGMSSIGSPNYNFISLNGNLTDGAGIGIEGGFTGDANLYFNSGNGGALIFRTGNGALWSEKARILAGGDVGIATTAPKSLLDVNGNVAIGTYAGVTAAPANGMAVSGQVGIGTTLPDGMLDVLASGGSDAVLGGGNVTGSELKLMNSGTAHFSIYNSGSHALTIADTSASGTTNTAGTPLMTIFQGGSVAIGTSSAATTLTVNGTVTATTFAGAVPVTDLDSGTNASNTTFWRGDGTWSAPAVDLGTAGGVNGILPIANGGTNASTATTALDNLFGGDTGTPAATLQITRLPIQAGLAPGGPYNTIIVNAEGIVTSASYSPVACTAPAPNAFSFTNQTGVALSTTVTSNAVTLSGFTGCIAAATCTGCTNILRNGVPNGTSANFVNGDTIALQLLSSSSLNTAVTATVLVGTTTSSTWSVTTGTNGPPSIVFTNQTGVGDAQTITSNLVTLGGSFTNATATCNAGCTGIYINGNGPYFPSVTGVNSGNTIAITQLSASTNNTATTATVTVGLTTSAAWQVTTGTDNCAVPSPSIGTVCADGSIYAGVTPDLNGKMFATPCDAGYTGSAGSCTGSITAFQWSVGGSIFHNVTSQITGRANTYIIHKDDTDGDSPYPAPDYCYNLNYLGHTDWYLPSLDEMILIDNNRNTITGFGGGWYWTSTEINASQVHMWSGNDNTWNKTDNRPNVRCIRNSNAQTNGTPAAFSFNNLSGVSTGQTITSNSVTLTGPFANVTATCGSGCTGISINGGAFSSSPVSGINSGSTITIQQTSSASYATPTTAVVTVGSTTSSPWQVTTVSSDACTGSPTVGTICADGSIYAGITPDGSVAMYATPCTYGRTVVSGVCQGTAPGLQWSANITLLIGTTNGSTGRANTYREHSDDGNADGPYSAADACYNLNYLGHTDWYLPAYTEANLLNTSYVAIGDYFGNYWTSTENSNNTAWIYSNGGGFGIQTKWNSFYVRCIRNAGVGIVNGNPDPITFTNTTNAPVGVTVYSNTVTLNGPFSSATASCGTGCTGISINGGAFVPGPVTGVIPGNTITIAQTSSASFNTMTSATVSVGGTTSSPWQVTTTATDPCTGSPAAGTVCADGSIYVGIIADDGSAKMFAAQCDAPMTYVNGSCSGSRQYYVWSAGTSVTTGVTSSLTGRENTYILHGDDTNIDEPYSAADYCYTLNYLGHTDWYLPAYSELQMMTNNWSLYNLANCSVPFWSSTETSSSNAVGISPSCNGYANAGKNNGWFVHCVRNSGVEANGKPNAFSFTNQSGVALSQTITSNSITLTGLFANQTATCGTGCTGISINGGPFSAGPVTGVSSNNTIAIQQLSSSTPGGVTTATVTVGGTTSSTWSVTTDASDPCAGSPSVGTICADGTVYAGVTPDGSVAMYAMPCDSGMTYIGGTCSGNRVGYPWSVGQTVTTGITNIATGRRNTLAMHLSDGNADGPYSAGDYCYNLNAYGHTDWYVPSYTELNLLSTNYSLIGGFNANYWTSNEQNSNSAYYQGIPPGSGQGSGTGKANTGLVVRCIRNANSAPSNTASSFSFTNATGVNTNTTVTSNTITLAGTFEGLTATCGAGCTALSANGGKFTTGTAYNLNTGSYLAIQTTSSSSASTPVTATVNVGSTPSTWTVTTGSSNSLGYFVMTKTTYPQNYNGSLPAWNAACLTDLTTNTGWQGYATANSNGKLVSGNVFLFGCYSNGVCNNLQVGTTYAFANASNSSYGGATFTTDVTGVGPNDAALWSASDHFGVNTLYNSYHQVYFTSVAWPLNDYGSNQGINDCCNWTWGSTAYTDSNRWNNGSGNIGGNYPAICFVNP